MKKITLDKGYIIGLFVGLIIACIAGNLSLRIIKEDFKQSEINLKEQHAEELERNVRIINYSENQKKCVEKGGEYFLLSRPHKETIENCELKLKIELK